MYAQNQYPLSSTSSRYLSISFNFQAIAYSIIIQMILELKKTQSANVEGNSFEHFSANRNESPKMQGIAVSLLIKNSKRVPMMLQSLLREKASEVRSNKPPEEQAVTKSRLGNMMKSKIAGMISSIKDVRTCEICEGEIKKAKNKSLEVYMCDCEHKENFCQSCLHHYVIYKVKSFEEVMCPHEGCPVILDTNTNFFKSLPADIQKNYKKIHQFYWTSKDPDLRMCPKENCDGVIKTTMENVMICNECKGSFCGKCLLAVHEGECDSHEVKFFESNLHYRQCKKCLFIIQKNQGCNHMTCRCGNQFCYVCGADWAPAHYGNHDENGNLVVVDTGNSNVNAYIDYDEPCCDCRCCNQALGDTCSCIMLFPLKIFLLLLLLIFGLFIFMFRDLWVYVGLVLVCFFAGMVGMSCERLCQLEGIWVILGILFFPFLMMVGIVIAFRQMFCEVAGDMCGQLCDIIREGSRRICAM